MIHDERLILLKYLNDLVSFFESFKNIFAYTFLIKSVNRGKKSNCQQWSFFPTTHIKCTQPRCNALNWTATSLLPCRLARFRSKLLKLPIAIIEIIMVMETIIAELAKSINRSFNTWFKIRNNPVYKHLTPEKFEYFDI